MDIWIALESKLNFNNFITIQIWCLTVTLFFVTFEKKLLYGDYHPFLVSWLKDHPPLNYCLVKFKYFRPMFNIKEKRYFIYFWCNYTCMHMKIINSGNILLWYLYSFVYMYSLIRLKLKMIRLMPQLSEPICCQTCIFVHVSCYRSSAFKLSTLVLKHAYMF